MPPSDLARPLTAADLMTACPRVCSPESPVAEAVRIFHEADCGAVPVVRDGKPVGVLSDRDVALALAEHQDDLPNLPVGRIAREGVIAVPLETSLDDLLREFGGHAVRRLLVVDSLGTLQGIIGWSDVAPYAPDPKVGRAVSRVVEAD